jgi:hypothetical protein
MRELSPCLAWAPSSSVPRARKFAQASGTDRQLIGSLFQFAVVRFVEPHGYRSSRTAAATTPAAFLTPFKARDTSDPARAAGSSYDRSRKCRQEYSLTRPAESYIMGATALPRRTSARRAGQSFEPKRARAAGNSHPARRRFGRCPSLESCSMGTVRHRLLRRGIRPFRCAVVLAMVVGPLTAFATLSASPARAGTLPTGSVLAWGYGPDGELGNGTTSSSDTPVAVSLPAGTGRRRRRSRPKVTPAWRSPRPAPSTHGVTTPLMSWVMA